MSNLAKVVQQLRQERDQAQKRTEQLDKALKALTGVVGAMPQNGSLLGHRGNENRCRSRRVSELPRLSVPAGQSGRLPEKREMSVKAVPHCSFRNFAYFSSAARSSGLRFSTDIDRARNR